MAALTPEQLAALAQQFSGNTRPKETSYGGYNYIPQWQTQYSGQEALDPTIGGYRRYVPGTGDMAGKVDGLTYEDINTAGNVTGTGTFSGIDGGSLWDYGPFLMLAAGMAPALMGAGAGAGAGATSAVSSDLAAMSGIGQAGLTEAQLSALIAEGAVPAGTGGLNFAQGFTDGGTAGGALDAGYATGSAGTPYTTLTSSGVVPNGTGGATSLLPSAVKTAATSLIPEGAKSLLGPAATIAGALAGGQGTPGQTTEKKMDPRLDQYVYGDLMPKVQGLLNSQMPMAQQAGQQMRQIGGGLLSAPIAGNGFNMFTKGRY